MVRYIIKSKGTKGGHLCDNGVEMTSLLVSEKKKAVLTADVGVPHPLAGKSWTLKNRGLEYKLRRRSSSVLLLTKSIKKKKKQPRKITCNQGLQLHSHLDCQVRTCGNHLLSLLKKMSPSYFPTWPKISSEHICHFPIFHTQTMLSALCIKMTKQFCIK